MANAKENGEKIVIRHHSAGTVKNLQGLQTSLYDMYNSLNNGSMNNEDARTMVDVAKTILQTEVVMMKARKFEEKKIYHVTNEVKENKRKQLTYKR